MKPTQAQFSEYISGRQQTVSESTTTRQIKDYGVGLKELVDQMAS